MTIFDSTRRRVNRKSFGQGLLVWTPTIRIEHTFADRDWWSQNSNQTSADTMIEECPEICYGLNQCEYYEVCDAVESARLELYRVYEERYGVGQYPTVGEIQAVCERVREEEIARYRGRSRIADRDVIDISFA